ncbi:MAG TPA: UPF0182 family protein [Jatrophihabitans sp.]|nr:UPF0182 family protein [Jatrophihabitans sp.]
MFKRGSGGAKRWAIRLLAAAAAVIVLWLLFLVAVRIITNDMWFNSVHAGSVYSTMLSAQILLFCVFGVIAGLIGGLTIFAVRRIRPPLELSADDDTFRWTFRKYEPRFRLLVMTLAVVIPGILIGQRAAGRWSTYLLWRHATPTHTTDPLFHKDISFYLEVYPFHRMVVALLLQAVVYGLWIAVIGGYWYGVWRIRRGRKKVTRGFTQLLSLLFAGYFALSAVNYWVSQYAPTTSQRGPVTGASYTDVNAVLPGTLVLVAVAGVCAVGAFVNFFLRSRIRLLVGVLVVAVLAVELIGSAWPGLLYHFREAPSAAKLDLTEIARNQKATRAAFGLDGDISTIGYNPSKTMSTTALVQLADKTAQTSVIDPNQLSPTFNVQQQLQAYYGFKSTLDTSHYDIGGHSQDVALAVRELQSSGIPQQSWVNNHLVYTHGYGIVAAPTTKVDPRTESPVYLDGGMPPGQQIPVTRPQIYYGQSFPSSSYAIVGQPAGSHQHLEFDHPGSNGSSNAAHNTYQGSGGIPIGSALRRFLFAVQMRDPNIFFSSEINSASQLLEVRNPRARVAKVAPWLTLDGDVYPAVVDGQIKWIVDGYTTSSNYPYSQLVNLHSATATTLNANGASTAQPSTQVNYMQNSVKAVVDAYTGQVSLYEWNQKQHPDPLLKAWEATFPGLVKPQSSIPSALLPQLRYPTDLFNVQRYLLAKYRVTGPANFYAGGDFWAVPSDPTVAAAKSINAKSASGGSTAPFPSKYMSMGADGYGDQHYSLSSPMVTLNGQELAGFVYVNSEPGPDYGKFTVLNFPSSSAGESPAQVQNDIESDTTITEALTLQRGGNSKVVLGALEAIPVAGKMLYVEPVYTQSRGGGASFPVLRHVIALYANGQPSFQNTLRAAIKEAIQSAAGTSPPAAPR